MCREHTLNGAWRKSCVNGIKLVPFEIFSLILSVKQFIIIIIQNVLLCCWINWLLFPSYFWNSVCILNGLFVLSYTVHPNDYVFVMTSTVHMLMSLVVNWTTTEVKPTTDASSFKSWTNFYWLWKCPILLGKDRLFVCTIPCSLYFLLLKVVSILIYYINNH